MTRKVQCDVDIDFYNRDDALSLLPHVLASRLDKGELKYHNTGVYFQDIPKNPLTGAATIDYKTAEERGYFKIDFLNVNAYEGVKSEKHIKDLIQIEPIWELLHEKDICDKLAHVNGYHMLLSRLNPRSVEELAIVLALMRPAKKHLTDKCAVQGFDSVKSEVWEKPTDNEYYFKRSHSISYATLIVMQLNAICESVK